MKHILAALLCLLSSAAGAQFQIPVTPTNIPVPPIVLPACPSGQFYNGALPSGCGNPPTGNAGVSTLTAAHVWAAGDVAHTFAFNSASALSQPLPDTTVTTFGNGFYFLMVDEGAGCTTLAPVSPAVIKVGPATLCKGDSAIVQVDDTGNWLVFAGVSRTLNNPRFP